MIYYTGDEIQIRDVCDGDIVSLFSWHTDREINQHDPRPLPQNSRELVEACKSFCNRFEKQGFVKCGEYLEEGDFRFVVMEKRKA